MIVFVSPTYRDLIAERAAVEDALRQGEVAPWGMEFFNSQPAQALDVRLSELRQSGAVVLIVAFRGDSLIPASDGLTYTRTEIDQARKPGLPVFVCVKPSMDAGVTTNLPDLFTTPGGSRIFSPSFVSRLA